MEDDYIIVDAADALLGIHVLPSEVLGGEIFPLVVHGAGNRWHRKILVLDQVCTRWRHILHSSPLLWTNCVPINTRQFSGLSSADSIVANYFRAIKMWLARSAPLPIPVSLDLSAFRPGTDDFARALDINTEIGGRWKSLHINVQWSEEADCETPLHALTEVAFASFPWQQHVRPLEVVSIPWSQLTQLSLKSGPPLTCRTVLVKCTSIVSAHLEAGLDESMDLSALSTASLAHLSSLALSVSQASFRATAKVMLPALTTLELFYDVQHALLPLHNIQKLTLNVVIGLLDSVLESADLCALLRCTPAVIQLRLDSPSGIENAFLDALRADVPATELLLPQLEMLWVHGAPRLIPYAHAENDQALAAFQAMATSRVGVLRRLVYKPPPVTDKRVTSKRLRDKLKLTFAAISENGIHVEAL
ncbi:hypothetical protein B0H16DRAFT_1536957 [Mycena metata]|uniref:F-box domain-containing protein n=1 Tax=Mycena metata TaxID=1033252 RepID=A0AAD7J7U2_9AGAR|nr:hypothetical protein B0H16DRAFT_1536957 [Mycena metata]